MLIQLIVFCALGKNPFCSDNLCTNCMQGYKFADVTCVLACPEGYIENSSNCKYLNSDSFVNITFADFLIFDTSFIADFTHPLNKNFSDSLKEGPIPTKDRGFYFANTSSLISSKNWVLAPNFTLNLFLRFIGEGKVFTISNSTFQSFSIKFEDGVVIVRLTMFMDKNTSIYEVTYPDKINFWTSFTFIISQYQSESYISLGTLKQSLKNSEFFPVPNMIFTLGGGFEGFVYEMIISNSANSNYIALIEPSTCNFNQFYDYNLDQCIDCPSTCDDWPWCTRLSCNTCFNEHCDSCTGFDYFNCNSCINSNIAPECQNTINCISGTLFNCTICESYYYNSNGICIVEPYLINKTGPAINLKINNNFSEIYGELFISGNNSLTFAPFANYEADDPYPVYNRGLYFNSSTYLRSIVSIPLNFEFSMAFWVYFIQKSDSNFLSSKMLKISDQFGASLRLTNPEEVRWFKVRKSASVLDRWNFLYFSVGFTDSTTTAIIGKNNAVSGLKSVAGYTFYDDPGNFLFGFSQDAAINLTKYDGFKGFLYHFLLWQYRVRDFSIAFGKCPEDMGTCLWEVGIFKYFNYYENKIMPCEDKCKNGCRTWGTCNQCEKITCEECSNYRDECIENIENPCLEGYLLTSNLKCCDSKCSDCYGPGYYRCLACSPKYFLNGNLCMQACPSFMIQVSEKCLNTIQGPVLDLSFDQVSTEVIDSVSKLRFSTIGQNRVQPQEDNPNPIPVFKRGFYFNGASILYSENFIISYNFTAVFYIKLIKPGVLVQKKSFFISVGIDKLIIGVGNNHFHFSLSKFNLWTLAQFEIYSDIDGILGLWLGFDKILYEMRSYDVLLVTDTFSSMTIGGFDKSFTGFLWRFQIYYFIKVENLTEIEVCVNNIQEGCVWDCDLQETLEGEDCVNCMSDCSFGCRFSNSCELCNDPLCYSCENYTTCEYCPENSKVFNHSCICNVGYEKSSQFNCSKCPNFYLEQFCFELCPLGYKSKSSECLTSRSDGLAVRFKFNKPIDVFIDPISQISTFSSSLDSKPLPTYSRGIYFKNTSGIIEFPSNPENYIAFGIRFFISFWILPEKSSIEILRKANLDSDIFSFVIDDDFKAYFSVMDKVIVQSIQSLEESSWNFLLLSVDFKYPLTQVWVLANTEQSYVESAEFHISDKIGGTLIFSSTNLEDSFVGFLYSIEIYVLVPILSELVSFSCDYCSMCPGSGHCIPDCNISSYNIQNSSCYSCQESCTSGCRYSQNCSICEDPECLSCLTYSLSSCIKCRVGFELINNSCSKCSQRSYYSSLSQSCLPCAALCESCSGPNQCTSCSANSFLDKSGKCACDLGYYGNSECIRKKFNAMITLSSNNEPEIIFTEILKNDLTSEDILVKINSDIVNVTVSKVDGFSFRIFLPQIDIKKNSKLIVSFIGEIVSMKNSILDVENLQIKLFVGHGQNIAESLLTIKKFTKSVYMSSIGVMIGASIINFDPNSFFTFLNSAELFYYIVLYSAELDEELQTFLLNIQISSQLPSLFDAFPMTYSSLTSKKLNTFGYSCNLLTVNSGFFLTLFIFLLILNAFIYLLVKLTPNNYSQKFSIFLAYFKYKLYLRFWVQTLFELFFCSLIGIIYSNVNNLTQILNLLLCCATLFMQALSFFLLGYAIYKRYSAKDFHSIQMTLSKYGLFFEDFNSDHLNQMFFYVIFGLRRIILSIIILALPFPVLQLSISIVMSLVVRVRKVLFYVNSTRCFEHLRFMRYFNLCEGSVLAFYLVILIGANSDMKNNKVLRYLAISIVLIVLIATIILSFAGIVLKLWKIYKNRKNTIKVMSADPVYIPELSINQDRLSIFKLKNSIYSCDNSINDAERAVQNSIADLNDASRSCIQSL